MYLCTDRLNCLFIYVRMYLRNDILQYSRTHSCTRALVHSCAEIFMYLSMDVFGIHILNYIYIYIYIYVCVCVCVCMRGLVY